MIQVPEVGVIEHRLGDACLPSERLLSVLECWFQSRLRSEFSGVSMCSFLKLAAGAFLQLLRFPPLL